MNILRYHLLLFSAISLLIWSCGKRSQRAEKPVQSSVADSISKSLEDTLVERMQIHEEDLRLIIHASLRSPNTKKLFPSAFNTSLYSELSRFYNNRSYRIAWLTLEKPLPISQSLLDSIENAKWHALSPEDYQLQELRAELDELYKEESPISPNQVAELDMRLTATYLLYAEHLLNGRINPSTLDSSWIYYTDKKDLAKHLQQAIKNDEIGKSLSQLQPEDVQYKKLQDLLAKYRTIKDEGGWDFLPSDLVLEPGDSSTYVWLVKKRLAATGDIDETLLHTRDSMYYTPPLERAIKYYQGRNGLKVDGIIGPSTVEVMNIRVSNRIDQIQLNLERIRWSRISRDDSYFIVNVPDFKLYHIQHGEEALIMNVIVGNNDHKTPIFSDSIAHIVFSPTWTVPLSISRDEMLPRIRSDSTYLQRNNYEVYDSWSANASPIHPDSINWNKVTKDNFHYRIVQKPGANNALGRIKFMFPNKFSVYMHDTPADHLFARQKRNLSHGCIRLNQPAKLALYLLEDQGWNYDKLEEFMYQEEPSTVLLKRKHPVQIVYRTAWVDNNNTIHFRPDVYGHDKKQLKYLKQLEEKL